MKLKPYKWYEANENEDGISTIALEQCEFPHIIGYNGILKGDKVKFQGVDFTVVVVSRMGYFGLSKTGGLPYTLTVTPAQLDTIE